MLSDEEKKAIESLIEIREFANLSSYKDTKISQLNAIDVVLNLIEKQSKEIEELKDESKEYQIGFAQGCYEKDLDWKDKIKAKIEYYEKIDNPVGKRVLQSLLEKE